MKQSDSIAKLAAALVTVQQHVTPVAKDATNPHFKNKYASLDSIMESVRPLLAGHGLSIIQGGAGPVSDVNGSICGVSVETMLVHTSGEYVSSILVLPLEKPSAQAVGSAVTYGRRYGVAALLALTTEDDDDGNVATANAQNAGGQVAARPTSSGNAAGSAPPVSASSRAGAGGATSAAPAAVNATAPVAGHGADEPVCPKCAGRVWDNRATKKNPKAPDFKCRDARCDGVIWPPKNAAPAMATAPAGAGEAWEPDPNGPGF